MTNGRGVYRGVNALQAKVNLIERCGRATRRRSPGSPSGHAAAPTAGRVAGSPRFRPLFQHFLHV